MGMGLPDNRREADSSYCAKALEAWSWWVLFPRPPPSKISSSQPSAYRYGGCDAEFLPGYDCPLQPDQFRFDCIIRGRLRLPSCSRIRGFNRDHFPDRCFGRPHRSCGACHASPKELVATVSDHRVGPYALPLAIFTRIPGMLTYRSRPQPTAGTWPMHAVSAPRRRDECHASRQKLERGFPLDGGAGTASTLACFRSVTAHQYRIDSTG
jgi:hypothetical protein